MKNFFSIIIFTLIIFLIIFNILSAFNIPLFGFRIFKIASGSMTPYLNVNDIVIIRYSKEYKENDVITFRNNDEYITHRIVEINEEEIITKGDANNTEDKPIQKDNIVGKLVLKIPGLGYIGYLISKPLTWIVLFTLGLAITLFSTKNNNKGKRYK